MLVDGKYPHFLKARIQSDHGHLGNQQMSAFLTKNINPDLQIICLAHLSKNNNTPEKALTTLHNAITNSGLTQRSDQKISILNRNTPTEIISIIK